MHFPLRSLFLCSVAVLWIAVCVAESPRRAGRPGGVRDVYSGAVQSLRKRRYLDSLQILDHDLEILNNTTPGPQNSGPSRSSITQRQVRALVLRAHIGKILGEFETAVADLESAVAVNANTTESLALLQRNVSRWAAAKAKVSRALEAGDFHSAISLSSSLLHPAVAIESASLRLLRAEAFLLAGEYQNIRSDTSWVIAHHGLSSTPSQATRAALTLSKALILVLGRFDAAEANLKWCVAQNHAGMHMDRGHFKHRASDVAAISRRCHDLLKLVQSATRLGANALAESKQALSVSVATRNDFITLSSQHDDVAVAAHRLFGSIVTAKAHLRAIRHVKESASLSETAQRKKLKMPVVMTEDAVATMVSLAQLHYQLLIRVLIEYDRHRSAMEQFYEPAPGASGGSAEGQIFAILDTNRDGWIDESEFFADWHVQQVNADEAMFLGEDRDSSGNISWTEFSGPKGRGPPPTVGGRQQSHSVAPDGSGTLGFLVFNNTAWKVRFPADWPVAWLRSVGQANVTNESLHTDADDDDSEREEQQLPSQDDILRVLMDSIANNTVRFCSSSLDRLEKLGKAAGNKESWDTSIQRLELHIMRGTAYAYSTMKGPAWAASEQRRAEELLGQFESLLEIPKPPAVYIGLGANRTKSNSPQEILAYVTSRIAFLERSIYMSPEAQRVRDKEKREKEEEEARKRESEEAANKYADDLYERLGVAHNATQREIKRAFRKAALKWHPDKHPNATEEAEEMFVKISEAMDVLGNETLRELYDQGQRKFDDMHNDGPQPPPDSDFGNDRRGKSRPGNQKKPQQAAGGRKSESGSAFWDDVSDDDWDELMRKYTFSNYPADYINGGWQLVWRLNDDGSRDHVYINVDTVFRRQRQGDQQEYDSVCRDGHVCLSRAPAARPPRNIDAQTFNGAPGIVGVRIDLNCKKSPGCPDGVNLMNVTQIFVFQGHPRGQNSHLLFNFSSFEAAQRETYGNVSREHAHDVDAVGASINDTDGSIVARETTATTNLTQGDVLYPVNVTAAEKSPLPQVVDTSAVERARSNGGGPEQTEFVQFLYSHLDWCPVVENKCSDDKEPMTVGNRSTLGNAVPLSPGAKNLSQPPVESKRSKGVWSQIHRRQRTHSEAPQTASRASETTANGTVATRMPSNVTIRVDSTVATGTASTLVDSELPKLNASIASQSSQDSPNNRTEIGSFALANESCECTSHQSIPDHNESQPSPAGRNTTFLPDVVDRRNTNITSRIQDARRRLRLAESALLVAERQRNAAAAAVTELELELLVSAAKDHLAHRAQMEQEARNRVLLELERAANEKRLKYLAHMQQLHSVEPEVSVPEVIVNSKAADTVSNIDMQAIRNSPTEALKPQSHPSSEPRIKDIESLEYPGANEERENFDDDLPNPGLRFKIGDQVQARWKGKGRWYLAQVIGFDQTSETYTVEYFDGDIESGLSEDCILADDEFDATHRPPPPGRTNEPASHLRQRSEVATGPCRGNETINSGSRVLAKWQRTETWYAGTIQSIVTPVSVSDWESHSFTAARSEGASSSQSLTAHVVFDDGDEQRDVAIHNLRPVCNSTGQVLNAPTVQNDPSPARRSEATHDQIFAIGTAVEARWKQLSTWYPATVVDRAGSSVSNCSVDVTDGGRGAPNSVLYRPCEPQEIRYSVHYADGDFESNVAAQDIRFPTNGHIQSATRIRHSNRVNHTNNSDTPLSMAVHVPFNLSVGQAVSALWKGGAGKAYPATVVAINNGSDTVYLIYDDGDIDTHVPIGHVSPLSDAWSRMRSNIDGDKKSPSAPSVSRRFEVGQHVYALWKKRTHWFSATIARKNDHECYDLLYDDGDAEEDVCAEYIVTKAEYMNGKAPHAGGAVASILTDEERAHLAQSVSHSRSPIVSELLNATAHSDSEAVYHWTNIPATGDRVFGNWRSHGGWYQAKITAVMVPRGADGGVPRTKPAAISAAETSAADAGKPVQFMVDLLYSDGDVEVNVSSSRVKPHTSRRSRPTSTSHASEHGFGRSGRGPDIADDPDNHLAGQFMRPFQVGDRVRANWQGFGKWYRAEIRRVVNTSVSGDEPLPSDANNGTAAKSHVLSYDIRYFDGDIETNVPGGRIRVDEYEVNTYKSSKRHFVDSDGDDTDIDLDSPATTAEKLIRQQQRKRWRSKLRKKQQMLKRAAESQRYDGVKLVDDEDIAAANSEVPTDSPNKIPSQSKTSASVKAKDGASHRQVRNVVTAPLLSETTRQSNLMKLSYRKIYSHNEGVEYWAKVRSLLWVKMPVVSGDSVDTNCSNGHMEQDVVKTPNSIEMTLSELTPGAWYEDVHVTLCATPYHVSSFNLMNEHECRTILLKSPVVQLPPGSEYQKSFRAASNHVTGSVNDASLDGGGWLLVRHAAPSGRASGVEHWHPTSDLLTGIQEYGSQDPPDPLAAKNSFSLPFGKWRFTQFLFSSGDGQRWLIQNRLSLMDTIMKLRRTATAALELNLQFSGDGETTASDFVVLHVHDEVECQSSSLLPEPHLIAVEVQLTHTVSSNTTRFRLLIRDIDPDKSGSALNFAHDRNGAPDGGFSRSSSSDDDDDGRRNSASGLLDDQVRTDDDSSIFSSHSVAWSGEWNTIACSAFLYADNDVVGDDGIGGCIASMRTSRHEVDDATPQPDVLGHGANVWIRNGDSETGYSNPLEGMCRPQTAHPTVAQDGQSDPTGLSCVPKVWEPVSDDEWMRSRGSDTTLLKVPVDENWFRASMSLPLASPMSFVRAQPGPIYTSRGSNSRHTDCNVHEQQLPSNDTTFDATTARGTRTPRYTVPTDDEEAVYRYCCRGGYWSPAWGRASERSQIYKSCTDFDHYSSVYLHHGKRNGISQTRSARSEPTTLSSAATAAMNASNNVGGDLNHSYSAVYVDVDRNPKVADCVIRMEQSTSPADSAEPLSDGDFAAVELCPYLLVKRLQLSPDGVIKASKYLGSFKTESRPHHSSASSGELVVHSFVNPDIGMKTVVEYVCDAEESSQDASNVFQVIMETPNVLQLRIRHHLGCPRPETP